MNATQKTYTNVTLGKCTMYFINGLGAYSKIELRSAAVEIRPVEGNFFAKKLAVTSVRRNCRIAKTCIYNESNHMGFVFVEGWGHFDPPNAFDASKTSKVCFDPEYTNDFDRVLANEIRVMGCKIVADYRGFNLGK
jgi:hypothetical protein